MMKHLVNYFCKLQVVIKMLCTSRYYVTINITHTRYHTRVGTESSVRISGAGKFRRKHATIFGCSTVTKSELLITIFGKSNFYCKSLQKTRLKVQKREQGITLDMPQVDHRYTKCLHGYWGVNPKITCARTRLL